MHVFGSANYPRALEHFRAFGARERRVSSPIFQLDYYLATYGDLENAFGADPVAA